MRTRLRLHKGQKSGSVKTGRISAYPGGLSDADGFALRFSAGQGIISLREQALSEMVTLNLLEMVIAPIAFPFDVSGGIRGLRNRRHGLSRLVVTVHHDGLKAFINEKLKGNPWFSSPEFLFEKDCICVSANYGPEGDRVPFSFRLYPLLNKSLLTLMMDHFYVYGPMPISILGLFGLAMSEFTGITPDGCIVETQNPLKKVLMYALPARGWRLPDYSNVRIKETKFQKDRIVLDFLVDDANSWMPNDQKQMRRLVALEKMRTTQAGDRLAVVGDLEAARTLYLNQFEKESRSEFLAVRLAMSDVLDANLRGPAVSLLQDTIQGEGDTFASAVICQAAALGGDVDGEVLILRELMKDALPIEKKLIALRLSQLVFETQSEFVLEMLQDALVHNREDKFLLFELMKIAGELGQQNLFEKLVPRLVAVTKHAVERAAVHVEIGRLLFENFNNPQEAIGHFERAVLAVPSNLDAAFGLASSYCAVGDTRRAIGYFEILKQKWEQRGSASEVAFVVAAIGDVWLQENKPQLAASRYREAMAVLGDEFELGVKYAKTMAQLGDYLETASVLERILNQDGGQSDAEFGETALYLSEVYLEKLNEPQNSEKWLDAALKIEAVSKAAFDLKAKLLERQSRWDELKHHLEDNLEQAPTVDRAISLGKASLNAGEYNKALVIFEEAYSKEPGRLELLALLIETSRKAGDKARLRDALKDYYHLGKADDLAAVALEIGDLELDVFKDLSQGALWFSKSLEQDGRQVAPRRKLVETLERLGETDLLDKELALLSESQMAAGEKADAAKTMLKRAKLLAQKQNAGEAAGLMRAALPYLQRSVRIATMTQMGELFFGLGNLTAARDMYALSRKEAGAQDLTPEQFYGLALKEAEMSLQLADFEVAFKTAKEAGSGPAKFRKPAVIVAAKALLKLGRVKESVDVLYRVAQNVDVDTAKSLLVFAATIATEKLKNLSLANDLLEELLEIDPGNQKAQQKRLALLENAGDRVALAGALEKYAADETRQRDLVRAAKLYATEKMHAQAVAVLQRAYEIGHDAAVGRLLAKALKRKGDLTASLDLLREHAFSDERAQDALVKQLLDLEGAEAFKTVVQKSDWSLLETAASEGESAGEDLARLARMAVSIGDKIRAKHLWRRAIAQDSSPAALVGLLNLLDVSTDGMEVESLLDDLQGKEQHLDISQHLAVLEMRVQLELSKGEDLAAVEGLASMMAVNPNDKNPWQRMVGILEKKGQWEDLADRMQQRLKAETTPQEAVSIGLNLAGLLEDKLGKEDEAMLVYENVLRLDDRNQQAQLAMARVDYKRQNFEALKRRLDKIDNSSWQYPVALWQARTDEHFGETAKAIDGFREICKLDPTSLEGFDGLVRLCDDDIYDSEIIQVGFGLLKKLPEQKVSVAGHRRIGQACLRLGEYDHAFEQLTYADEHSDGDPATLILLEELYDIKQRRDLQVEVLEKLAYMVDDEQKVHYLTKAAGFLLEDLFEVPKAHRLMKQAVAIAPNNPDVLLKIADTGWATGDVAAVAHNLERYRLIAPERGLDPSRQYKMAVALLKTKQWPVHDIAELLLSIIKHLPPNEQKEAFKILDKIKTNEGYI